MQGKYLKGIMAGGLFGLVGYAMAWAVRYIGGLTVQFQAAAVNVDVGSPASTQIGTKILSYISFVNLGSLNAILAFVVGGIITFYAGWAIHQILPVGATPRAQFGWRMFLGLVAVTAIVGGSIGFSAGLLTAMAIYALATVGLTVWVADKLLKGRVQLPMEKLF